MSRNTGEIRRPGRIALPIALVTLLSTCAIRNALNNPTAEAPEDTDPNAIECSTYDFKSWERNSDVLDRSSISYFAELVGVNPRDMAAGKMGIAVCNAALEIDGDISGTPLFVDVVGEMSGRCLVGEIEPTGFEADENPAFVICPLTQYY